VQGGIELQAQALDVVRERLLSDHRGAARLHRQRLGLLHLDAHRPQWHALAGEDGALRQFFCREQVAELGEFAHLAFHQAALARATAAHAATVRELHALSQGSGQQRFACEHPNGLGIDGGGRARRFGRRTEHAVSRKGEVLLSTSTFHGMGTIPTAKG